MFSLPKRPGPYIVGLLLIALLILTVWLQTALTDPAVQRAIEETQKARPQRQPEPGPPLPPPARPMNQAMDPVLQEMHQEMTQRETPPERELEILQELLTLHQRALGTGSFGDNGDVTRALIGDTAQGVWLPRQSPRIRDGQLLDRWGTAYWFHANAGHQIEIRSAGPDQTLFTSDDLILNGSPAGFGATPAADQ